MIADLNRKAEIQNDWSVVETLARRAGRQYVVAAVVINEHPREEFWNLPFFLAYAVLDDVLAELLKQGTYVCKRGSPLGIKMAASRSGLQWIDYALVEMGKDKRNDLAHRAVLLAKKDCLKFIDAIEVELKTWQVI